MKSTYHPPDPFLYQAAVVRVVTPVTYDLQVDCGFNMTREVRIHLRGVELPDDYDPDTQNGLLSCVSNWVQAAEVGADDGEYPLWIRTYKHADPSDGAEPGEALYEADVVRKCDADNLREHVTTKYPNTENGVNSDRFDFLRGADTTPDCSVTDTEDDADQS